MIKHFLSVRDWHGVPGVVYPVAAPQVQPAVPQGWLPIAEAARRLGYAYASSVYSLIRLRGLRVLRAMQLLRTKFPGVYCRKPVMCVCWAEVSAAVSVSVPLGYISREECCSLLSVTNPTLSRWAAAKKMRSVLCFDRARGRFCRFYHAADVEALASPSSENEGWLTARDAAEQLGVSVSWLTCLLHRRQVRGRLVKGRGHPHWLVEPGSVMAEVLRRRGVPCAEDFEGWLTLRDAAEQFGLSVGSLSVLLNQGKLHGVKVRRRGLCKHWLVEPGSVMAEVLRRRGLRVNDANEYVLGS